MKPVDSALMDHADDTKTPISRLPNDQLVSIFSLVVAQEAESYSTIRASCKRFREVADDTTVASSLDIWTKRKKAKVYNPGFYSLLGHLSERGNVEAQLVFGIQNFFNLRLTSVGKSWILKSAWSLIPETWYALAMALIATKGWETKGYEFLLPFFKPIDPTRKLLRRCRQSFRHIVTDDGRKAIPATYICKEKLEPHWDRWWGTIHDDGELKFKCPNCCIDIETLKLRSGFL